VSDATVWGASPPRCSQRPECNRSPQQLTCIHVNFHNNWRVSVSGKCRRGEGGWCRRHTWVRHGGEGETPHVSEGEMETTEGEGVDLLTQLLELVGWSQVNDKETEKDLYWLLCWLLFDKLYSTRSVLSKTNRYIHRSKEVWRRWHRLETPYSKWTILFSNNRRSVLFRISSMTNSFQYQLISLPMHRFFCFCTRTVHVLEQTHCHRAGTKTEPEI
jgi:hypothetical protein